MPLLFKRPDVRSRWPFWLLLGAWFCANSPQSATYHVAVWLSEARHFSHQQRLAHDVVFALTGQQPDRAERNDQDHFPVKSLPLAIPADATLKKIELALDESSDVAPPVERPFFHAEQRISFVDRLRPPPPHTPPRAS